MYHLGVATFKFLTKLFWVDVRHVVFSLTPMQTTIVSLIIGFILIELKSGSYLTLSNSPSVVRNCVLFVLIRTELSPVLLFV